MHACNWSTTVKIEEWKGRSAKIDNLIIHAFVCLNSYKLGTWNCELSLFPCNAAHAVRNVAAAAESLIVNQCNISYKIVLTLHYFLHFTVSVPLSLEYLFQNTCPLQRSRCTSCKFCPYLNAFPQSFSLCFLRLCFLGLCKVGCGQILQNGRMSWVKYYKIFPYIEYFDKGILAFI